jgi:arginyl-tRNA synthetase
MIDKELRTLVRQAITHAHAAGDLRAAETPVFDVTQPQRREHGDWTTNVALVIQKAEKKPPRVIAEKIIEHLPQVDWVRRVEIAGPGFINFHLSNAWLHATAQRVLDEGTTYGKQDIGKGAKVNLEFVSMNPTGPMTVAHGRHAVVGDSIARLLEFTNHNVTREYYFNDRGTQMDLLAASVDARHRERNGEAVEFKEDYYQGDYVKDVAAAYDEQGGEDLKAFAYHEIRRWVEETLAELGVHFDIWRNERDLYDEGHVQRTIETLRERGLTYEKDGATWLSSEQLGDSRDRVLIRSIGEKQPTYLLPDIAYHLDKAGRGFDLLIDIFGADHHGQVPSLEAVLPVLGVPGDHLEFIIVQFVHLYRGGSAVPMGKRTGQFVTMKELMDEVGIDATRYTMLQTSVDHDINFDIEEVKRQTLENPVYYVQYAHARIASILRAAVEQSIDQDGETVWDELHAEPELDLMRSIANFEEVILVSTNQRAPYRIAKYAEDLARQFHRFYTECRVLTEDEHLTRARLALARATKQVLANALGLLGVDAPERMERQEDELV